MILVLIAGEGANEIGRSARQVDHEAERTEGPGVIEELLGKVRVGGWKVREAVQWKDVRKLRANVPGDGDARTVAALALRAREKGCHALVLLRDRDGRVATERDVLKAAEQAQKGIRVAAGVPREMLECWLLALRGEKGAHADPDPVAALRDRHGIAPKKTTAMVELVRNGRLLDAPADASSLWSWLRRVAVVLEVSVPSDWPRP
jgi:hypothetical protein